MSMFKSNVIVGKEFRELVTIVPGKQRTLTKISASSRVCLLRIALGLSTLATSCVCFGRSGPEAALSMAALLGSLSNDWLHTAERLKYYEPSANFTTPRASLRTTTTPMSVQNGTDVPLYLEERFFKNATLGPWLFCWQDRELCHFQKHYSFS